MRKMISAVALTLISGLAFGQSNIYQIFEDGLGPYTRGFNYQLLVGDVYMDALQGGEVGCYEVLKNTPFTTAVFDDSPYPITGRVFVEQVDCE